MDAPTQEAKSFPLFAKLPIELQRAIWEFCVPTRIIELDVPYSDVTKCQLHHTSFLNTRAPVVTRVCRESRDVALFRGGAVYPAFDRNGPTWYTDSPKWYASNQLMDPWHGSARDVLHLNWEPGYEGLLVNGGINPIPHFLWLSRQKRMHMSITSDLVLRFGLTGPGFAFWCTQNFDMLGDCYGPYLVSLWQVNLHVGLDLALCTNLFGRLGEERVQLVGAGNKALLKAYHELWAKGPAEDQEPAEFFDLALQRHESDWLPMVKEWHRRLEIAWVRACWHQAHEKGFVGIKKPSEIWLTLSKDEAKALPQYGVDQLPSFLDYLCLQVPNKEHPWVIETLQNIPRFEPTAMFRLCERRCFSPPPPRSRGGRGRGRGRCGILRGGHA